MGKVKSSISNILTVIIVAGVVGVVVYFWQDLNCDDAIKKEVALVREEVDQEMTEQKEDLDQCRTEKDALSLEIMNKLTNSDNPDVLEEEIKTEEVNQLLSLAEDLNEKFETCSTNNKPLKRPTYPSFGEGVLCNVTGIDEWPALLSDYEYKDISSNIDKGLWEFSIYDSESEKVVLMCDEVGCETTNF